jgi:phage shock protein G
MFEFLFLMVFMLVLLFTGISMLTVFAAVAISFVVMFLVGMLGFALKLLPWLLLIALGVWFYKRNKGGCRRRHYYR